MKNELLEKCNLIATNARLNAKSEVQLFCQIMEWSDTDTFFVADDPHGGVSLGDYFFNMSDIHEVVANYPKLLERYGSNEAIATAIIRWYDFSTDWHSEHTPMEWVKIKSIDKFTEKPHYTFPEDGQEVFIKWGAKGMTNIAKFRKQIKDFMATRKNVFCIKAKENLAKYDNNVHYARRPDYWCPVTNPDDSHNINLHSWLNGADELVKKGGQK